jgi:hypothetical protein
MRLVILSVSFCHSERSEESLCQNDQFLRGLRRTNKGAQGSERFLVSSPQFRIKPEKVRRAEPPQESFPEGGNHEEGSRGILQTGFLCLRVAIEKKRGRLQPRLCFRLIFP